MSNNLMCPACGSHDVEALSEQRSHQLTLGEEFNYLEHVYKCKTCGEMGDFDNKNDDSFKLAEQEALKKLVPYLVEALATNNISMAQFERAFELPQRTLTRWKSGDFSSASVALLRVIKTFPFIVNVAEKKFEPGFAHRSLVMEALKVFGEAVNSYSGSFHVSLSAEPAGVSVKTDTYLPSKTTPILTAVG